MIKGLLYAWSETGTEGIYWSIQSDYKEKQCSYDNLFVLENGDYLKVFDENKLVWEGVIDYDYEVGWKPYPRNPDYGQQCVCGMWCHGIQKGVEPEIWAEWFGLTLNKKAKQYLGELDKHENDAE